MPPIAAADTLREMPRALALALVGPLICVGTASAEEIGDRVRALYRPYEKEGGTAPSATRVIRGMATKRLGTLLDRDEACSRKQGVCNLGFDVIVNGQDYQIADVQISTAEVRGDRAGVTARFMNMGGRHETRYDFVREGDGWKLDDIEALAPKDLRWRLSSMLAPGKGKGTR